MMKKITLAFISALAALLLASGSAFAGGNDIDFSRLCGINGCTEAAVNQFKTLARAYSSLLAPMHFQPASTLGEAGFEVAVESKMSFSISDDPSWKATNANDGKNPDENGNYSAPDLFATVQLHMRKGLPFSLEVEGIFNWLADSEIFYVGVGLRWAITEGWWFLPDISVRAHAGTIVGASQFILINLNVDAAISYTWSLGGICAITPYAGYSLLSSWASSHVFLVNMYGVNGSISMEEQVFDRTHSFMHRGFVGLEFKGDFFVFGAEGEFGKDVMSVGVKIGANF